MAVKTKLILHSIDVWLLQQPALIDKRKRALLPAVRERQALADALARYLAMLGLERRHKVQTVTDVLTTTMKQPRIPRTCNEHRRAENVRQDCVNACPKRFWTVCESLLYQAKKDRAARQARPLLFAAMSDGRLRATARQRRFQQSGHRVIPRATGSGMTGARTNEMGPTCCKTG